MSFGPTEILFIAAVVVLLFGSTAIPRLARSLGATRDEFHAGRATTATASDATAKSTAS